MNDRILFSLMSPAGKKFYSKVFNRAILNLHAVRTGLFDTLLCETEDPRIIGRWNAAVPKIVEAMQKRAQDNGDKSST